jgi:hypothetical protein
MWIFISHSTAKDDQAGLDRLKSLSAALKTKPGGAASGHDVLLDFERLEPAAKWRSEIDEWLAQCHAAVLMLTPKSLESAWVLKEATILAHRTARDDTFYLFPVLLEGLKRDDLIRKGGNFAPLYLDAIQRVGVTDPAGIAAAVMQQLAKLAQPPITPLKALEENLANLFRAADKTPLERICERVTCQAIAWSPNESRPERCAREVARAIVRHQIGGYRTTGALIQDLLQAGITKEFALRALNLAAPLWVEGRAAVPIADFARRNLDVKPNSAGTAECWAIALNGALVQNFTADMYLRRAYLPGTATVRSIEGGESETRAEDLIERIRNEVRNREPTLNGQPAQVIDRYLRTRTAPYFIVLPPPVPDAETLGVLQNKYYRVTFIAHTGEVLSPEAELPPRLVPVDPAVDLDAEMTALQDFSDTREQINKA